MNQPPEGNFPLKTGPKDRKVRVLVAPLDWGLGHATRCIPIIRELIRQGAEPCLAASGPTARLLEQEFPGLAMYPLRGYEIRYARSRAGLFISMLFQIPRMLASIRQERAWLKELTTREHFDAIISDNRYGLSHARIPTVFITHQLRILSPLGKWNEALLQWMNYRYIKRFTQCWVPDHQRSPGLAGILSHPEKLPAVTLKYTGPLSRFTKSDTPEKKGHLLILLSGPEPQRSMLEDLLSKAIAHYPGTADFVRGLPGAISQIPSTNMLHFHNHLSAEALQHKMEEAEFVIARSGYSTVMDLAVLHKKSILIPTPGQTEQEYLGKFLQERKQAVVFSQAELNLTKALETAAAADHRMDESTAGAALEHCVTTLLRSL